MNSNTCIQNGTLADLPVVLEINQSEVVWTSNLNLATLEDLVGYSVLFKTISCQQKIAGFVLAIDSGSSYQNRNLQWLNKRTTDFWYIDRIVVASEHSGQGYGRKLYEEIFDSARANQVARITCEYCTVPMNSGSAAFHKSMGFTEIGTRTDEVNQKKLSMQIYEL